MDMEIGAYDVVVQAPLGRFRDTQAIKHNDLVNDNQFRSNYIMLPLLCLS